MPRTNIIEANPLAVDLTELVTGLSALAAGILWFCVFQTITSAPELCSSTPANHCLACYPAAVASLTALVGGVLMVVRHRFG